MAIGKSRFSYSGMRRQRRYIRRPIEKLYPLEVKATGEVSQHEIDEAKATSSNTDTNDEIIMETRDRPTREAADNGILIRRLLGQM